MMFARGDARGAEQSVRRSVDLGSPLKNTAALFSLGTLLANKGDDVGAEDAFRKVIDTITNGSAAVKVEGPPQGWPWPRPRTSSSRAYWKTAATWRAPKSTTAMRSGWTQKMPTRPRPSGICCTTRHRPPPQGGRRKPRP